MPRMREYVVVVFGGVAKMSEDGASSWLGPGIAFASVLVSATIGFASWHNSNIQQEASMFTNFYGRSGGEEAFWKALYDDYLGTFDERFESRPEWRRARLLAIFELARSREIPAFEEFRLPQPRREYWTRRLTEIRTSLYNGLDERAAADPALRAELVRRGFGGDGARSEDRPANATENAAPAAEPRAPPVITAAISTQAAVVNSLRAPAADDPEKLSEASESGWDVDVFWCRGARQDENYRRANMLGREFGRLANAGQAIAPGVRLGRVRTRPASIRFQRQPSSAASRTWVIADNGEGEAEAAAAVRASANVLLGQELVGAGTSIGTPTRWYLSMFLCGSDS
jgi:hypothetical protein